MDTNGNAWLLEINPRWSASMELHEAISGYSWMREHLRAITGDRTPVKTSEPVYSTGKLFGKAIVYAPRNLETTETSLQKLWDLRWLGTVSELEEQSTDGPFRFRVADIPKDTHFPEGVPVLTVYSTGANHSELIGELTRGREEVLKILESR